MRCLLKLSILGWIQLLLSCPLLASNNVVCSQEGRFMAYEEYKDTTRTHSHPIKIDSIYHKPDSYLKLNQEAIHSIQFDFLSDPKQDHHSLITSPIDKPWMEYQVDLSIPKSLIDTTKVRRPRNYIRMLPYTIWVKFGEDPVYDVLVFGNKKRFDVVMNLNLDDVEEFGRALMPNAGRYNPNRMRGNASVVIRDLDFIGFLYSNLNKQGRIRKHNRKHANAWKTYNSVASNLPEGTANLSESVEKEDYLGEKSAERFHHYQSVALLEEKNPIYSKEPNYKLLQTSEQRSRFGTFYDPELYALPTPMSESKSDSISSQTLSKSDSIQLDELKKYKKKHQLKMHQLKESDSSTLKELPNSMSDLYRYIEMKKQQDSIRRKELFRKDKTNQNVYEFEQQQRKLKERQN